MTALNEMEEITCQSYLFAHLFHNIMCAKGSSLCLYCTFTTALRYDTTYSLIQGQSELKTKKSSRFPGKKVKLIGVKVIYMWDYAALALMCSKKLKFLWRMTSVKNQMIAYFFKCIWIDRTLLLNMTSYLTSCIVPARQDYKEYEMKQREVIHEVAVEYEASED